MYESFLRYPKKIVIIKLFKIFNLTKDEFFCLEAKFVNVFYIYI